jgi:hypothetical protein
MIKYMPRRLEVSHCPAFTIAIPGSDVHLASVTCEACGTRAKLKGLASLPSSQDEFGAAAESRCRLISMVQQD